MFFLAMFRIRCIWCVSRIRVGVSVLRAVLRSGLQCYGAVTFINDVHCAQQFNRAGLGMVNSMLNH